MDKLLDRMTVHISVLENTTPVGRFIYLFAFSTALFIRDLFGLGVIYLIICWIASINTHLPVILSCALIFNIIENNLDKHLSNEKYGAVFEVFTVRSFYYSFYLTWFLAIVTIVLTLL